MTSDQETPGAGEITLPPFVIEPARSGRSKCKTCRRLINKGDLRLGVRIEGPFGLGYIWHHINCAAKHQFDRLEAAYRLQSWKAGLQIPPLDDLKELVKKAELKKRKQSF